MKKLIISVSVDEKIKKKAHKILDDMNITLSTFVELKLLELIRKVEKSEKEDEK